MCRPGRGSGGPSTSRARWAVLSEQTKKSQPAFARREAVRASREFREISRAEKNPARERDDAFHDGSIVQLTGSLDRCDGIPRLIPRIRNDSRGKIPKIVRKNQDLIALNVHDMRAVEMSHRFRYTIRCGLVRGRRHDRAATVLVYDLGDRVVACRNNDIRENTGHDDTPTDVLNHRQAAKIGQRLSRES